MGTDVERSRLAIRLDSSVHKGAVGFRGSRHKKFPEGRRKEECMGLRGPQAGQPSWD